MLEFSKVNFDMVEEGVSINWAGAYNNYLKLLIRKCVLKILNPLPGESCVHLKLASVFCI